MTDDTRLRKAAEAILARHDDCLQIGVWVEAESLRTELAGTTEPEPCSRCGFTGPHTHTHQGKPAPTPEEVEDAEDFAAVVEADLEQGDTPLKLWEDVQRDMDATAVDAAEKKMALRALVLCKECVGGFKHAGPGQPRTERCDHPYVMWIATAAVDKARGPFLALLDDYDDALCARKHGGVAAGDCVDGLRKLLGVGGFERRKVPRGTDTEDNHG